MFIKKNTLLTILKLEKIYQKLIKNKKQTNETLKFIKNHNKSKKTEEHKKTNFSILYIIYIYFILYIYIYII